MERDCLTSRGILRRDFCKFRFTWIYHVLELLGIQFSLDFSICTAVQLVWDWINNLSVVFPHRRGGTGPILVFHQLRSGNGGRLVTCSLCRLIIKNLSKCLLPPFHNIKRFTGSTLYMMAPIRVARPFTCTLYRMAPTPLSLSSLPFFCSLPISAPPPWTEWSLTLSLSLASASLDSRG